MASIPSTSQYQQSNFRPNVFVIDQALTAKRQQLRTERRAFLTTFDTTLQEHFDVLSEAKETGDIAAKRDAGRIIEIHVLLGIDKLCKELGVPENTKEDVEHISLRLLGLVTCYGWEAYEQVVDAIRVEYNWRQAEGGHRWELPDSVRQKGIEVAAKKRDFEEQFAPVLVSTTHPNNKLNKPTRAEIDRRRADNRAKRLAAQPPKGASGGSGGQSKGKGGNNKGK